MAYDGLVNYYVCEELNTVLIDGKVDKIFQPNAYEIILDIYQPGNKYSLDISVSPSNYHLCLTHYRKTNPKVAPNFCMFLRKYLVGTKITKIATMGLERLVIIEFDGYNKSKDFSRKKLVIELMGKHSNIILINDNGIIIDSLKHFDTSSHSYRNIFPKVNYIFPVSHKFEIMNVESPEAFYKNLLEKTPSNVSNDNLLSTSVANTYNGISNLTIATFIEALNLEDALAEENAYKIYCLFKSDTGILKQPTQLSLVIFGKDYTFALSNNPHENLPINTFLDDFYYQKEQNENFTSVRQHLSRMILNYSKKLNVKLANINQKIEECQNVEKYRLYGELITNNLYRIKNTNIPEIALENYYDNNSIIVIPLDKSLSPSLNAKKYFKKYNKLKHALGIVSKQKELLMQEINYIESIVYSLQSATTIEDVNLIQQEFEEAVLDRTSYYSQKRSKQPAKRKNKKVAAIGEPIKYSIDSFTVLVGKNNKQNDYITKQSAPDDIWFHTKTIHGSHVILKIGTRKPKQEIINKCAAIAAYYSKASQDNNVAVDYTLVKHVKKPSGAKFGMVTYTNYQTVIVKPNKFESAIIN